MSAPTAPRLSIVLPACEEAENLRAILPALHAALKQTDLGDAYEILVIDTPDRRDDTEDVCAAHGALHRRETGQDAPSYGGALREGIALSRGEWVATMDADGSHPPADLPRLWSARNDADLVIASRYMKGGRTANPPILVWMSLAVNVVFHGVLGLQPADISSSYRLYRGDSLRALPLECLHFDIAQETLVKLPLFHPGYRIREIPFYFEQRRSGKTKRHLLAFTLSYLTTLATLWKLKRRITAERQRESANPPKAQAEAGRGAGS